MLPNHAPLVVAEQFGTLEGLFPGRIDLGLGRAPGTDPQTARALPRNNHQSGEDFPRLLAELQSYFSSAPEQTIKAHPGAGMHVPIWGDSFEQATRLETMEAVRDIFRTVEIAFTY